MADPLSIAASVAGLLTTAGKICSVLSGFVGAVADAPHSARAALGAVEEVRVALEAVRGLIDTVSGLPSRRRRLVRLDYIRITFANCVLTLSELEALVCAEGGSGPMHRLRWAWGEKKALRLLPRLESQKASLSLMVTVLLW
jgi:cell division control protein 24